MALTDEERARLLERRARREEDAQKAKLAHDDLCLQLEDRFTTELGPRGQAWDLVNEDNTNGEGPICIKLGDPIAHKQFMAKRDPSVEDQFHYVKGAVLYPEASVFNSLAVRRPQLLGRAAAAVTGLYGFSEGVLRGKL